MASELRVDKIIPTGGVGADSGNTIRGGGIIQVIQNSTTSEVTSNANTSFVDTGLNCTIQPKFQTSKILIIVNQFYRIVRNRNYGGGGFQLVRGSTVIQTGPNNATGAQPYHQYLYLNANAGNDLQMYGRFPITFLDTPNTLSAIVYKTQMACNATSDSSQIRAQYQASGENGESEMICMEVSA